jgi:hypothetical protein
MRLTKERRDYIRAELIRHRSFCPCSESSQRVDLLDTIDALESENAASQARIAAVVREAIAIARRHQTACASMGMPGVEVAGCIESSLHSLATADENEALAKAIEQAKCPRCSEPWIIHDCVRTSRSSGPQGEDVGQGENKLR